MRIGIDLGGTKIEGLALDKGGVERERLRVPTPPGTYEEAVKAITGVVAELERRVGAHCTVGVAMPGAISPATGLVKNANSTRLNGHPLKRDLERPLGREVRMANDANCFAMSEATDGAAAGCCIVFGVILGTGVGGGIVVDGSLYRRAGDRGRMGPQSTAYAGRQRAARSALLLRTDGLHRDLAERAARRASVRGADRPHMRATDIAEAALGGDSAAAAHMELYCDRLARALAGVVNIIDPHAIVLGGGLSRMTQLYKRVPELWKRGVFSEPDHIVTRLLPPRYGDSSGVRGAAWLWPE